MVDVLITICCLFEFVFWIDFPGVRWFLGRPSDGSRHGFIVEGGRIFSVVVPLYISWRVAVGVLRGQETRMCLL
jgi:hypothetical protein